MHSNLNCYKECIILTIFFLIVRQSTQKYQLVKKNEPFNNYVLRSIPDGMIKLNMNGYFNSIFNLDYQGIRTSTLESKGLKINNKYTAKWCDDSYKTWQVYKRDQDSLALEYYARNFKTCLGDTTVNKIKHCFERNLDETLMSSCIKSVNENEKLAECAGTFERDMFYYITDIQLETRTLNAVMAAIRKRDNRTYKNTVLDNFFAYTSVPSKKIPDIQKACIETFLDSNIFDKLGEEFRNCLGNSSAAKLRSCVDNPSMKFARLELQNNSLRKCLESKKDPNIFRCMDELKKAVDGYGIKLPPNMQGADVSTITLFLAKEAIHSNSLRSVEKCPNNQKSIAEESEKIIPFSNDLIMLNNCIGDKIRPTLLKCLTHYDKHFINQRINAELIAPEKEKLLKCANDFDRKVTLDLNSSQRGSSDKSIGKSMEKQLSRVIGLKSCFCSTSQANSKVSFEDNCLVFDQNGDLHKRILKIMEKLFFSNKNNLIAVFNEYAGLETVTTTLEDILYCKRKTELDSSRFSKITEVLPRVKKIFESKNKQIAGTSKKNEQSSTYESKTDEDYLIYMLEIKVFQDEYLPLSQNEWEVNVTDRL